MHSFMTIVAIQIKLSWKMQLIKKLHKQHSRLKFKSRNCNQPHCCISLVHYRDKKANTQPNFQYIYSRKMQNQQRNPIVENSEVLTCQLRHSKCTNFMIIGTMFANDCLKGGFFFSMKRNLLNLSQYRGTSILECPLLTKPFESGSNYLTKVSGFLKESCSCLE